MVDEANSWLKPEDALTRFKKPEVSLLNKQDSGYKYKSSRYGFVIESMGFLIAENTLSEIIKNTKICPLPNTKVWMKGLINIRGNLIPVYDFSVLLGLSNENDQYHNLLVLGKGSQSVALLIDTLPRPCDIDSWQKLSQLPCHLAGLEEHVVDAYASDDIVWMDFNQESYFESIKHQLVM